jgi:hypothetical protein
MNVCRRILRVRRAPALALLVAMLLLIAGCGGGSTGTPIATPTPPAAAPVNIQGQWQVIAHSAVNPAGSVLVETNFTQTGADVVAGKSSVVLIQGSPGAFTALGGECDNGSLGDDSVQATIANQTQLSFTLTEAGSLGTGSSIGTATISSDGTQITSGTYSTLAACGFTADNGSLTGTLIKPFSGTYAGTLLNGSGTDTVTVTVTQTGYSLSVVGTDNGTGFTLTGTAVGATFDVTGTIAGQTVEDVGIFEPATNDFRVYDTAFQFLGVLTAQSTPPAPSPVSVVVAPVTASVQTGQAATFTATVANDSSNRGVAWAVSGTGCTGAACGTLSAASSASGVAVTYTAPATVPNPATVTLTATSVTDPTKNAEASITLTSPPAIAVSVSPTTASVATGGSTQSFTATLQNDSQNKGVTWTLSGAGCSGSVCGTVSPTSSASGAVVTYTSPANAGTVKLTATSVSNNAVSAAATITLTSASATGPENLGAGSAPTTVVDSNGVVDIAWVVQAGIEFAQSKDNGVTFSSPKLVLPLPSAAGAVSIQVDAQNDIVIFTSYNVTGALGASTAILARSTDGGETFSNIVAHQDVFNSILLVQSSGVLDLAYTNSENGTDPDNAVHESRSTDGGKTFVGDQFLWGAPIDTSAVRELRGAVGPEGQVYLTWTETVDIPCEIHFIASLDGVNFLPHLLVTNTDVCNDDPTLVVDAAGNVNLAWLSGNTKVFFMRSTDQGQTFAAPVSVTASFILQDGLQFAVDPNGAIDLVFDGIPNFPASPVPSQVYFTRSLDHGATWSAAANLSLPNPVQTFTGAKVPSVGVDPGGKLTVAWEDDTNGGFAGDNDIYIRTSTDGATFSGPVDVSHTTDQIEISPIILETPNGTRYLSWYDMTGQQSNPVLSVFFYAVQ